MFAVLLLFLRRPITVTLVTFVVILGLLVLANQTKAMSSDDFLTAHQRHQHMLHMCRKFFGEGTIKIRRDDLQRYLACRRYFHGN